MDKINTQLPYEGYCVSRIGGRSENQDTCGFVDTPYGLLVLVCDGMGGGPAGKTASVLAVQTILKSVKNYTLPETAEVDRKQILQMAIKAGEQAIVERQMIDPSVNGMGTTVVALLINDYSAIIAHVGDSRCYQFRFGRKQFRTEDHSFVGNLVRSGQLTEEQARLSSQSNIITRALSGRCSGEPDITEVAYEKGDRFILCSDGIWGTMPENDLIKRVCSGNNLPFVIEKLATDVDEEGKKNGGGHDNLTIAIIRTQKKSKLREPMTRKYRFILIGLILISFLSLFFGVFNQCRISTKDKAIEQLKSELAAVEQQEKPEQADARPHVGQVDQTEKSTELDKLKSENEQLTEELVAVKESLETLQKQVQKNTAQEKKTAKETAAYEDEINQLKQLKVEIQKINKLDTEAACTKAKKIKTQLNAIYNDVKDNPAGAHIKKVQDELAKSCSYVKDEKREGQLKALVGFIDTAIQELKK